MAGTYVSLVMEGMLDVDPTSKLVAAILGDCANIKSGGIAYPSQLTIARRAGISDRHVRNCLDELQAAGWIIPDGQTRRGPGQSTRWHLNIAKLQESVRRERAEARFRSKGGTPVPVSPPSKPEMKTGTGAHQDRNSEAGKPEPQFRQTGYNRNEQEVVEPGEPATPVSQTGNTARDTGTQFEPYPPKRETVEESRERQLKALRLLQEEQTRQQGSAR